MLIKKKKKTFIATKWLKQYLIGYRNEIVVAINRNQFMYNFIATKIVEVISYRNEIVVAINGIIATKSCCII